MIGMNGAAAALLASLLLSGAGAAHAQYKCVRDGKVSFQELPCAANEAASKLDVPPARKAAPAAAAASPQPDWAGIVRRGQPRSGEEEPVESSRRPCPTPQQIRELEFEASRIENRNRRWIHRDLADARACR
jgi:hypothetical protein